MSKLKITVTTVQHGFALEIGNKSWLLENEQQLAQAVVYRVGLGMTQPLSKKKMAMLLKGLSMGIAHGKDDFSKAHGNDSFSGAHRLQRHTLKERKHRYHGNFKSGRNVNTNSKW